MSQQVVCIIFQGIRPKLKHVSLDVLLSLFYFQPRYHLSSSLPNWFLSFFEHYSTKSNDYSLVSNHEH